MGRTSPTFRALVDDTERRFRPYRRGLRARDVDAFDRLFEHARAHADAASLLNHEEPLVPMLVSVDLEQQRRIDDLERRLEALEAEREGDAKRDADRERDGHDDRRDGHDDRRDGHDDRRDNHDGDGWGATDR